METQNDNYFGIEEVYLKLLNSVNRKKTEM